MELRTSLPPLSTDANQGFISNFFIYFNRSISPRFLTITQYLPRASAGKGWGGYCAIINFIHTRPLFPVAKYIILSSSTALSFTAPAPESSGTSDPEYTFVFKHVGTDSNEEQRIRQAKLGCAPAHKLFDLVESKIKSVDAPRSLQDYENLPTVNQIRESVPNGVEVYQMDELII